MGVTLDLRIIDHERIVLSGLPVVNDAIRNNDPEILRDYLRTLPIDVDPSVVEYHQARLARLREVKAPEPIIQNDERFLRMATGEPYRPEAFQNSTLDELRHLLGTWCWLTHSYSLDKAWEELRWFLQPRTGPADRPLHPQPPPVGDSHQSTFDKALDGSVAYPTDALGQPVIRTCGSVESGCSGYNPPEICKVIAARVEEVDQQSWKEHIPFRTQLYRQAIPGLTNDDIADFVADELAIATDTFPVLLAAYAKAAEKGFGVSCEYSL
jgi:hypothetical protein